MTVDADIFFCPLCKQRLVVEEDEPHALHAVAYHVAMECPRRHPQGTESQQQVLRALIGNGEALCLAFFDGDMYVQWNSDEEWDPFEPPAKLVINHVKVASDGTILSRKRSFYNRVTESTDYRGRGQ